MLLTLEQKLSEHLLTRTEILFLPIGIKEWKTLEREYDRISADSNIDPIVVPLPLFSKDYFGRATMTPDEVRAQAMRDKYPSVLPICDWESYDIALHCPEKIYIQFPYDNEQSFLTIVPLEELLFNPQNIYIRFMRSKLLQQKPKLSQLIYS